MREFTKRFYRNVFPWIILVHAAAFIAFWLTNSLFYASANDYLTNLSGIEKDYVSLCLVGSGLIAFASVFLLFYNRRVQSGRRPALIAWIFGVISTSYLVFFYGSFSLLLQQSPVQLPRLGQMILYYRLILDPVVIIGLTILAAAWLHSRLSRQKEIGLRQFTLVAAPVLVVLILIWVVPIFYPPDSVYPGALPPKPLIVAHRGASMLAPENTLAAAEKAADLGAFGAETDIHVSQDGVLVLMHDDTLNRTTDVTKIFPGRQAERIESFSIAELKQLNAGRWFVEKDPFKVIANGTVSSGDQSVYRSQAVPTLADALNVVRDHKLNFIFDLEQPPAGNPYSRQFFDMAFKQIHAAGIDSQIWFLVDKNQIDVVRSAAPAIKPAYGVDYQQPPQAVDLAARGYKIVNAEYGLSKDWIAQYQASGLWVNLYTIDEPWQFSRLWLLGVNSTTTSNVQAMSKLGSPILSLPYQRYLWIWGGVGLLGFAVLLGAVLISLRKNSSHKI
jgi:glycerophosphoryl diester phosphodiesterase